MAMKAKHTRSDIRAVLDRQVAQMRQPIVNILHYAGEECVNIARNLPHPPESLWMENGTVKSHIPPHQPNYIDWTANLRSSIGYVVVEDGEVVGAGGFRAENGGEKGAEEGRRFAEDLALQYPSGYALIIVAGMHYAAAVQSKGYDVLSSATIEADQIVPQLLKQLEIEK